MKIRVHGSGSNAEIGRWVGIGKKRLEFIRKTRLLHRSRVEERFNVDGAELEIVAKKRGEDTLTVRVAAETSLSRIEELNIVVSGRAVGTFWWNGIVWTELEKLGMYRVFWFGGFLWGIVEIGTPGVVVGPARWDGFEWREMDLGLGELAIVSDMIEYNGLLFVVVGVSSVQGGETAGPEHPTARNTYILFYDITNDLWLLDSVPAEVLQDTGGVDFRFTIYGGVLFLLARTYTLQILERRDSWVRILPTDPDPDKQDEQILETWLTYSSGANSFGGIPAAVQLGESLLFTGFALMVDSLPIGEEFSQSSFPLRVTRPTLIKFPELTAIDRKLIDTQGGSGEHREEYRWVTRAVSLATQNIVAKDAFAYFGGEESLEFGSNPSRIPGLLRTDGTSITQIITPDPANMTNTVIVRSLDTMIVGVAFCGFFDTLAYIDSNSQQAVVAADRVAIWRTSPLIEGGEETPIPLIQVLPDLPTVQDSTLTSIVVASEFGLRPTLQPVATGAVLLSNSYFKQLQLTPETEEATGLNWILMEGPTGMAVSNTGLVSWVANDTSNPHVVKVYVSNTIWWDAVTWNVHAQTQAPVIGQLPTANSDAGIPFEQQNVTIVSGDVPVTWSLDTAPTGMVINDGVTDALAIITWSNPVEGTHPVTVRATNLVGFGLMGFNVVVTVASATVITTVPDRFIPAGVTYQEDVTLAVGQDPTTWSLEVAPAGAGIIPIPDFERAVVFWPAGSVVVGVHTFTVKADSTGGIDTETWTVTVS